MMTLKSIPHHGNHVQVRDSAERPYVRKPAAKPTPAPPQSHFQTQQAFHGHPAHQPPQQPFMGGHPPPQYAQQAYPGMQPHQPPGGFGQPVMPGMPPMHGQPPMQGMAPNAGGYRPSFMQGPPPGMGGYRPPQH
mmetsp:Transcript_7071/g.11910  ORF Transcript_7071/g.11910 Transcript_7071/m.11910 type:complete len:134 (+) Transcript_7071:275-676(+)